MLKGSVVFYLICMNLYLGTAFMAKAADINGHFGVRGAGLVSCNLYQAERKAKSTAYHVIAAWMDGYITASNQYALDVYDVASFESTELIASIVNEHCVKHPEAIVFSVVNSLIKQLSLTSIKTASNKVVINAENREVLLYEELIVRMLSELASIGFYHGDINSEFNNEAENSIKKFQSSVGLNPTGFPDQITLWRLFNRDDKSASPAQ
ncbi:peptidoglycan-binding domain-containing protein [Agarivorans sp. MS3-6]|uniref:peptidoglycan-binding domain-containing protein n=1 Tax=Agarivorans sp. TSD2052 TaxID=2937286 RepID=UPI002010758A|nr:peptidoglycan-binding domain-containing protein [Agarivorans sp. TSD2052]UPW20575.1 peptidoglycan-binding protein [Agarivorans sp. TSD2052]